VDVEHFGFLSWVLRKRESHEQDGETLSRAFALNETASGDPAMALRSSVRLARTDIPSGILGGLCRHATAGRSGLPTTRADIPRAKKLNGECRAFR
jgi:hypothetical protein